MRRDRVSPLAIPVLVFTWLAGVHPPAQGAGAPAEHDYAIKPVPFTAVHLNDVFWAPRIETNRKVTIPFAFQECELTGRVENFMHAAQALRGQIADKDRKIPPYPFDDTDIYKVIEGASYSLSVERDPKLESYVDGLIAKIAA
ncbi:MAG: glycoside hydrolase family 127 protein, partial [Acidobacteriia bacterium]|nr:glycoside hydrolase family 127 protein [Terriglobia bacterium]